MERIIIRYLSGTKANTAEVFPISRFHSIYMGRDASCDVRMDPDKDDMVSRSHAVIEWRGSDPVEYQINDLLSSNGTYLNGRRITQPERLATGDRIQLGRNGPTVKFDIEVVAEPSLDDLTGGPGIEPSNVTRQIPAVDGPLAPSSKGRRGIKH